MEQRKRHGQILKIGGEMMTTYPVTGKGLSYLIGDYYHDKKVGMLAKADGFTNFHTSGVFNPIYGKRIIAGMFASTNMFTAIGARPYAREGVRIMYQLAQKGNIGATTIQDGDIGDSVMAPIEQVREPFKELPFPFDYGLSLKELVDKDDVIEFQDYIDKMAVNYADGLDTDLLRPTQTPQPTFQGIETTLNGISRVIGSSAEVGQEYDGTTITAQMVSPYGGIASDLYPYRSASTINNFDGYVDYAEGALSLSDMNRLYDNCVVYWDDQGNPNNKVYGMSIVAQERIGSLMNAQNIFVDSVFVQRDFNGVKTVAGREGGGILLNSFRNVPMMVDGNYNYDPVTHRVGTSLGEIHLLDLDYLYLAMLSPVEFRSTQDFAITRQLREKMVMHMRAETRIEKFLGQGKITNKTV